MTIAEAAKYIGIPAALLERWVWDGAGPKTIANRRHNNVRFEQSSLDKWLRENRGITDRMIGA